MKAVQIARRLGCSPAEVHGVVIWGNHSKTQVRSTISPHVCRCEYRPRALQFPDARYATVARDASTRMGVPVTLGDDAWLQARVAAAPTHAGNLTRTLGSRVPSSQRCRTVALL